MRERIGNLMRRAGQMMLEFSAPQVFDKDGGSGVRQANFVTEADVAVQSFLMEELSRIWPEGCFFAEEKDGNVLTDKLTFVIDPIDGTTNYFRQRRCSAVSVGVLAGREPVFGAIFDPYHDALYTAEKGKGAWCGETRLRVSGTPYGRALIGLGSSPYNPELARVGGAAVAALLPEVADIRRTGSACIDLCDVAAGRSEAYFEWILQPWDYCAATLLINEAGGRCGSILGSGVVYDRPMPYMGASAAVFDRLQETLQRVWQEHGPR